MVFEEIWNDCLIRHQTFVFGVQKSYVFDTFQQCHDMCFLKFNISNDVFDLLSSTIKIQTKKKKKIQI